MAALALQLQQVNQLAAVNAPATPLASLTAAGLNHLPLYTQGGPHAATHSLQPTANQCLAAAAVASLGMGTNGVDANGVGGPSVCVSQPHPLSLTAVVTAPQGINSSSSGGVQSVVSSGAGSYTPVTGIGLYNGGSLGAPGGHLSQNNMALAAAALVGAGLNGEFKTYSQFTEP